MIHLARFLPGLYNSRNRILIITIIFVLCFYFHPLLLIYYKRLSASSIFYYAKFSRSSSRPPLILLYTHNRTHKTRNNICLGTRNGGHVVNFDRCPKKCQFSCQIQDFMNRSPQAVLFFSEDFYWPFDLTDKNRLSAQQRWIFWSWESPINHKEYIRTRLTFNWTMTYRQDSDIVHAYGRYISRRLSYKIRDSQAVDFFLSEKTNQSTFDVKKEFSSRKNKALWIVSNCKTQTHRHQIAIELSKYLPIDTFGGCSILNSTRTRLSSKDFERTLFKYKFYLAFENSNCQDYITEKAFYNALAHGSIPIVLGTNVANYKNILPPNSFIHVEQYENLETLADQLINISQNINKFKYYHQWRIHYRLITWPSNYFIDDLFCNLCIKLYEDKQPKSYRNFPQWLNKCK